MASHNLFTRGKRHLLGFCGQVTVRFFLSVIACDNKRKTGHRRHDGIVLPSLMLLVRTRIGITYAG